MNIHNLINKIYHHIKKNIFKEIIKFILHLIVILIKLIFKKITRGINLKKSSLQDLNSIYLNKNMNKHCYYLPILLTMFP
jgi:hypothetical protein